MVLAYIEETDSGFHYCWSSPLCFYNFGFWLKGNVPVQYSGGSEDKYSLVVG